MISYCAKCGTPLKKGQSYCMKCGYNNQTGSEEKLRSDVEGRKISFKSLLFTALTIVLSCLSVYFIYQFTDQNVENIQTIIVSFSKEMLKNITIILGISIFIESLLAYRTMDDSLLKSLFSYTILYLIVLAGLIGYTFVVGTPIELTSIPIFTLLIGLVITGLFYFLAKFLTSGILYKMKTGKYILFLIFYTFFRILSWIVCFIILYILIQTQILVL